MRVVLDRVVLSSLCGTCSLSGAFLDTWRFLSRMLYVAHSAPHQENILEKFHRNMSNIFQDVNAS